MADSWIKGSLHPPLRIQVARVGVIGDVFAPGDVAVLRVRRPDGTRGDLSLAIEDAATGIVRRDWIAGDTAVTGLHRGTVVINPGSGGPGTQDETFPADGSYLGWTVERGL